MTFDPSRLQSQLQTTGLANKDSAHYQLLFQIIKALRSLQDDVSGITGGGGGGGSTVINEFIQQYIGIQGESGETGEDGPPGFQGRDGHDGTTGAQGPVGPVIIGLDGEDGFDGFNIPNPGPAGPAGSTAVKSATIRLTDAQIKSLSTTPIQIVAAAGANIIISVLCAFFFKSFTGGTYSTGRSYALRYSGIAVDITNACSLANTTNLQYGIGDPNGGGVTDGSDPRNTAIVVRSSGDVTGGNAANFLEVTVIYEEFDMSVV